MDFRHAGEQVSKEPSSYYNGRNDSFRERDAASFSYDKGRRGGHQSSSHTADAGQSRGTSSRTTRNAGSSSSHQGSSKQYSGQPGYTGTSNGHKDSNGSSHRTSGGHARGGAAFGDKDIVDPWSSWQRSKSGEPPSKMTRREEGHLTGRGGGGSGGAGRASERERSRERGKKRSLSK